MKFKKMNKIFIFNILLAIIAMLFASFIYFDFFKYLSSVDDVAKKLVYTEDEKYLKIAEKVSEIKILNEIYPNIKKAFIFTGYDNRLQPVDYRIHKRINNKDEELRVRVMVDVLSEKPDSIKFYCSRSKIPPFLYNLFIIDKLEYIKQEKCFR